MKVVRSLMIALAVFVGIWLLLEIGLRLYVELPLKTDFYGSIARDQVRDEQFKHGVRTAVGNGWIHLGWIADPDNESYTVEKRSGSAWIKTGESAFGSYLTHDLTGNFRVIVKSKKDGIARILGEVSCSASDTPAPIYKPVIDGPWKLLFKPSFHGYYINDQTVFRDSQGRWRLLGITSKSIGNYEEEKYFASGFSDTFPPENGMVESNPVADFGELAWAPHVLSANDSYHLYWSPHRLEYMNSKDGVNWDGHRTIVEAPYNKFFRDSMIYEVAEGQWLLYTTARGAFFSQVDTYQSFDLIGWQYIGCALQCNWGSERNSPFASTESPFVLQYKGLYYLSVTYNNDTFFWNGLLLPLKIWIDRPSYNETLLFQSDNPYDFGTYRGKAFSPSLVTVLQAHAPEYVHDPETDRWFITTAGWPWVATLTSGEAAYAPLKWEIVNK